MKKSKLHLMSWLLLLASILLISCKKDEPNQKKETPRNPEVVAQEQELPQAPRRGRGHRLCLWHEGG